MITLSCTHSLLSLATATADANIEGVEISTWFGGSDNTWGPSKDVYTMFRNFKLWRDDAVAPVSAQAVLQSLPPEQVVVVEDMEVAP